MNTSTCTKYRCCLSIFEQKKKRQFIYFLFTVVKVTMKNTTHTLIFAKSLDAFKLSEAKAIKGFDRGDLWD